jgi:hypothetical protein
MLTKFFASAPQGSCVVTVSLMIGEMSLHIPANKELKITPQDLGREMQVRKKLSFSLFCMCGIFRACWLGVPGQSQSDSSEKYLASHAKII